MSIRKHLELRGLLINYWRLQRFLSLFSDNIWMLSWEIVKVNWVCIDTLRKKYMIILSFNILLLLLNLLLEFLYPNTSCSLMMRVIPCFINRTAGVHFFHMNIIVLTYLCAVEWMLWKLKIIDFLLLLYHWILLDVF